jgi:hypothetical protein
MNYTILLQCLARFHRFPRELTPMAFRSSPKLGRDGYVEVVITCQRERHCKPKLTACQNGFALYIYTGKASQVVGFA